MANTIHDVALDAGVSTGTVSRVINGNARVTGENVAKVQKSITKLGYQRCRSAEFLAERRWGSTTRTGNIGMIFMARTPLDRQSEIAVAYVHGAERACEERGFHALIEGMPEFGEDLPRCVREKKVDGLLIKATRSLPAFVSRLADHFPTVILGLNDPTAPVPLVVSDERSAGWVMTEYLWRLGHRRIAFVCSDVSHPVFLARYHGYEAFLRTERAFDPSRVVLEEAPSDSLPVTPELITRLSRLWQVEGEKPTAIVAANDTIAASVYRTLHAAGLKIPYDVSVVGLDNFQSWVNMTPQLTSFATPFSEVARVGALELLDWIREPKPRRRSPSLRFVQGQLVERASVRPLSLDSGVVSPGSSN